MFVGRCPALGTIKQFGGNEGGSMAGTGSTREPPQQDISTVTVLCQGRRLDLALPSSVPCGELMPVLLRLLVPARPVDLPEHQHGQTVLDAADKVPELKVWQLAPIAGPPIGVDESLRSAGILDGDLVELRSAGIPGPVMLNGTVRDRIEDVVTDHSRFWTGGTTQLVVHSAVVTVSAGLLIPVARLPPGLALAGLAGMVAVLIAVIAATMVRRSADSVAAVALLVGCGWAWLAGTTAFLSQVTLPGLSEPRSIGVAGAAVIADLLSRPGQASGVPAISAVAVGGLAALLLAACAVAHQPAALTHTTALLVVVGWLLVLAAGVLLGIPVINTGSALAVCAVLSMGGLPRAALLAGGLTNSALVVEPDVLDVRFARSDRVLTGSIIGVSLVAATVAVPAAFVGDRLLDLFAGGIGLALLLRSRAFSQIPHAIGPRIAGPLAFGALWVAAYRSATGPGAGLLLVLATCAVAVAMAAAGRRPADSPVGWARASRLLTVTEQLLVVLLVVLATGICGLFDWLSRILG